MIDPFNDSQFKVGKKYNGTGKQSCNKCNKDFELNIFDEGYPNREDELVLCPYCREVVGHIRTSGTVKTYKA